MKNTLRLSNIMILYYLLGFVTVISAQETPGELYRYGEGTNMEPKQPGSLSLLIQALKERLADPDYPCPEYGYPLKVLPRKKEIVFIKNK